MQFQQQTRKKGIVCWTFIPPSNALDLERFPQAIDWIFIEGSNTPAVWQTMCGLIVHACQGLKLDCQREMIVDLYVQYRPYQQVASLGTFKMKVRVMRGNEQQEVLNTYNTHARYRTTQQERPSTVGWQNSMLDKLVFCEIVTRQLNLCFETKFSNKDSIWVNNDCTDDPIDVRRMAASMPRTSPRNPSALNMVETALKEFLQ